VVLEGFTVIVEVRSVVLSLNFYLSVPSQIAIEEEERRLHLAQYERVHAGQQLLANGTSTAVTPCQHLAH
jgi:hypothetical protein